MTSVSVNDIVEILKKSVDENSVIDVSTGTEEKFGVSKARFQSAVKLLKAKGYNVYYRVFQQEGTDKRTSIKVLANPELTYRDVYERTRTFDPEKKND